MSTYQHMEFCKICQKQTIHFSEKPNHILHLLLSIITVGIWIPMWIIITLIVMFRNECNLCGGVDSTETIKPSETAHSLGYELGKLFRKRNK
jgi:hypothetical protein